MLSDADWIGLANDCLPPNVSALDARIVEGSRTDRFLQVSYRPGSESFTFISLRGGFVAEMLGQTAAHCGTLRDELRVPNADDDSDTFACRDWQRVCRHSWSVGRDKRLSGH